jgi:predicted metal-dependent phosphoesterase TrpH
LGSSRALVGLRGALGFSVLKSPPTFDLQSHSLYSDGSLPPRAVVELAAAAGVELLALSDHDSVAGLEEALLSAATAGIRLAASVEISAIGWGAGDLHVLGYLLDHRDPRLLSALERFRSDRERRARAMADSLRELGFELDESLLHARGRAGETIGRPHLAQAVVTHPGNATRLAAEGRTDPTRFLEAYLVPGRPAFEPRLTPSVEEAIEVIHAAGGLAVWAHPFWAPVASERVIEAIDRFRDSGLDGVECFYLTHTREQTDLLANRCEALGLLATGSSDFHGPDHKLFSRFRAFSTYGREPVLGSIDR